MARSGDIFAETRWEYCWAHEDDAYRGTVIVDIREWKNHFVKTSMIKIANMLGRQRWEAFAWTAAGVAFKRPHAIHTA